MAEQVECVVIGAGVVGLAIARALAMGGREVIVIERNPWIGNETSSRNNEVTHAGFLYPPNSLRGQLCRPGAQALIKYCGERGIDVQQRGKLILALNDAEEAMLAGMLENGVACGVPGLELLSPESLRQREPDISCQAALHSPETGVVDSHAFMLALQGDAEDAGAMIAFNSEVTTGSVKDRQLSLSVSSDGDEMEIDCEVVVNAAGLGAATIAEKLSGFPPEQIPSVSYSKGRFMSYTGKVPFEHIVVPLGETLAMGGAMTLDLAGRAKFGPDQSWVEEVDYDVPDGLAPQFAGAVARYWPDVDETSLTPDYSGIRPRCWGPNDPPGDWNISGPGEHGVSGLINLFGIETPGLTASLAIADYVTAQLETK